MLPCEIMYKYLILFLLYEFYASTLFPYYYQLSLTFYNRCGRM